MYLLIIDVKNSLREELQGQQENSSEIINFRYIYNIEEINPCK